MKPDTPQILDSVIWSLQTYVEPEVASPFGRSVLLTVGNLLRHVKLRAESEAELLFEDNNDLVQLLERLETQLKAHSALSDRLDAERAGLRKALAEAAMDKDRFPTVARLNACAVTLRRSLDELLKSLSSVRAEYDADSTYIEARQDIRAYLARQLKRMEQLIKPAFVGGRR